MAMSVQKTKLDVKGKEVNIGADVPKRSWHGLAFVEGVIVVAGNLPPACDAQKELLWGLEGTTIRVA